MKIGAFTLGAGLAQIGFYIFDVYPLEQLLIVFILMAIIDGIFVEGRVK